MIGSTEAVVKHTPQIDTPPENGILDDEEEFINPFLKFSLKLPNEDIFINHHNNPHNKHTSNMINKYIEIYGNSTSASGSHDFKTTFPLLQL